MQSTGADHRAGDDLRSGGTCCGVLIPHFRAYAKETISHSTLPGSPRFETRKAWGSRIWNGREKEKMGRPPRHRSVEDEDSESIRRQTRGRIRNLRPAARPARRTLHRLPNRPSGFSERH